jgi:hypothetical protein
LPSKPITSSRAIGNYEVQEEIDALLEEIRANGPHGIQVPPPLTDEELAEMDADEERYIEQLLREEAEWCVVNPGVPRILGSDLIDEDRGPR